MASEMDGLSTEFWYATAGSNSDNDCGKCFHVRLERSERFNETDDSSITPKRDVVVQVINSGGDVGYRQFDLFVGAGGFGVYTACNVDCQSRYCNGGSCHDSLYDGTFDAWTNSEYDTGYDNQCYGGGVKWFPPFNKTQLLHACERLVGQKNHSSSGSRFLFKDEQLFRSCYYSNLYGYHQNFGSYRATRVQCPRGLYMLTGLRRDDDATFLLPTLGTEDAVLTETCQGATCITTMCDCCKPSCAWTGKGRPSKEWSAVRTCDKLGFPF